MEDEINLPFIAIQEVLAGIPYILPDNSSHFNNAFIQDYMYDDEHTFAICYDMKIGTPEFKEKYPDRTEYFCNDDEKYYE